MSSSCEANRDATVFKPCSSPLRSVINPVKSKLPCPLAVENDRETVAVTAVPRDRRLPGQASCGGGVQRVWADTTVRLSRRRSFAHGGLVGLKVLTHRHRHRDPSPKCSDFGC